MGHVVVVVVASAKSTDHLAVFDDDAVEFPVDVDQTVFD